MINEIFSEFFFKHITLHIVYFICNIYIPLEKIALPHYYGKLIDVLKTGDINKIKNVFIYLTLIWILIQVLNIGKSFTNSNIFPEFIGFVRMKLIGNVIESYKCEYKDLQTGKLLTKLIDAPYLFYNLSNEFKNLIFSNLITYASTFCYLFYYDRFMGMVFLILTSIIIYITYIYVCNCKPYVRLTEDKYVETQEEIDDSMINLLSIYTSNKSNDENNRLKKYSDISINADKKLYICNTNYRIYYSVAFIIIFIIMNYFTLNLYLDKKIKMDVLVSIVIINYGILTGFMSIFYDVKDFMDNLERIKSLDDFMKEMPEIKNDNKEINIEEIFKKSYINIEIKNLSFSYDKKQIFKNFNLKIEKKEHIALTGNIGSGKSTLVKLIVGLKRICKGSGDIIINGKSINNMEIDKLRDYITYIPQHPKLFNRTLFENITYGIENIREEAIYSILKSVQLDDIIHEFKKMMHKKVGKNGSHLSGGQRQIVWLVRSLLKNNRMIILDEPTSSLDEDNKIKVIKLIKELGKKRNIILITHDKSLLGYMNRIIKLDKGKIIKDVKFDRK